MIWSVFIGLVWLYPRNVAGLWRLMDRKNFWSSFEYNKDNVHLMSLTMDWTWGVLGRPWL